MISGGIVWRLSDSKQAPRVAAEFNVRTIALACGALLLMDASCRFQLHVSPQVTYLAELFTPRRVRDAAPNVEGGVTDWIEESYERLVVVAAQRDRSTRRDSIGDDRRQAHSSLAVVPQSRDNALRTIQHLNHGALAAPTSWSSLARPPCSTTACERTCPKSTCSRWKQKSASPPERISSTKPRTCSNAARRTCAFGCLRVGVAPSSECIGLVDGGAWPAD